MEDSAAPEAVVPVAGNEELMAMSEFIRNLDVSLKLFLLLRVLILLYYAKEVKEVQQPKAIERQEQTTFSLIYRYASHNRFRK
jgi:cell division protein FtsZ